MSPLRSICPGDRLPLGPLAGAVGVLATAGLGICLAFSNAPEAAPQRAGGNDQETPLSARSNTSPSPLSAVGMPQTATVTSGASAASNGSIQFPSAQPAGLALGPLSPPWIEVVPPWDVGVDGGLVPPVGGPPVARGSAPFGGRNKPSLDVTAVPGVGESLATALHRPRRSPHAPGAGRPHIPPRVRAVPADRTQGLPTPQASPQAPPPRRPSGGVTPSRRADPPAPARGMPNPCATMNDFRRQPCEQVLDRLTR